MTLDEAFAALSGPLDTKPFNAMHVLDSQWDEAKPRCLAMLHRYATGQDQSEATEKSLIAVLHLLADHEETAACADLCALARDPERIDLILGDMTTDVLPAMLISCFDGNAALLEDLVKQADVLPVVRDSALMALAFLTQSKAVSQAAMQALLVEAYDLFPAEPGFGCWVGWAHAVALLGFGGLAGRVQTLFERKLIDPQFLTSADFHDMLRQAKEAPGALDGFYDIGIGPIGFVIGNLTDDDGDDEPAPPEPIINPLRHIGRNDPCPCGSGKKYKKCCLV